MKIDGIYYVSINGLFNLKSRKMVVTKIETHNKPKIPLKS